MDNRFPEMPMEPPEEPSGPYCLGCGEPILDGERVIEADEGFVHADKDCILDYINDHYSIEDVAQALNLRITTYLEV